MVLVVLATLGAFSDGRLIQKTAVNLDGTLSVEFQRFMRSMSDENFTIRVRTVAAEPTTLTLGRDYMDNFFIQSLQPQPLTTHVNQHEMVLTWLASDGKELALWLTAQPQSTGHLISTIRLKGAEPVTLDQWVLP